MAEFRIYLEYIYGIIVWNILMHKRENVLSRSETDKKIAEVTERLNPQNPVMQGIYEYLEKDVDITQIKLKQILGLKEIFSENRNFGTHRKLYSKEEVENILKKLMPIVNDLIEYLSKLS